MEGKQSTNEVVSGRIGATPDKIDHMSWKSQLLIIRE